MHSKTKAVGLALIAATATAGIAVGAASDEEQSATLASKIDSSKPKNVILFIGDGMGDSEVTSGRYYGKGATGRLNMDKLPFRGSSLHYVLTPGPGPDYKPNYTGDSAPTAVAWSTGKRTIDGRLAQGPSSAPNVPGSNAGYETYMEIAHKQGKATGNVSTAEITDATPGGPSAHISQRACQGPADTRTTCPTEAKTAGGLGSIAEQEVDLGYDLILGGGRGRWEQPLEAGGTTNVLDYAQTKGYTQQVGDKAGLAGITSLAGGKVLGLFNAGNMTTEFKPLYARTKAYYDANPGLDPQVQGGSTTTRCDEGNRSSTNEPSLADMTEKAIELLKTDPDGFTLQVEGASIDKRDHAADVCGQIGELLGLDKAIGVAQEFQKTHPDTLIIVTADHSHTSQIGYTAGEPATGAAFATLETVDGAPMRMVYGTADTGMGATTSGSQMHTGAQVPVWASGPQAANIQGTIGQTDIFSVLNGKTPSQVGPTPTPIPATPAPTAAPSPAPTATPAPVVKVTCKVFGSRKVTCTFTFGSAKKKAVKLTKSGRTIASGKVSSKGAVTFKARRSLTVGTYTVRVGRESFKLKLS